jgi:hypothetical protein
MRQAPRHSRHAGGGGDYLGADRQWRRRAGRLGVSGKRKQLVFYVRPLSEYGVERKHLYNACYNISVAA